MSAFAANRTAHRNTEEWSGPNGIAHRLVKNYIDLGKLGNKSDKGGLYPPPQQGHGTKILLLNMYQGVYSGELPTEKLLSSGQLLEVTLNNKSARPAAIGLPLINDGAICSAKLDGSDIETVIPIGSVHTPKQLHIDSESQKIYICDREGLRIHRANLDSSQHEIIVQTGDWEAEADKMHDATFWPVGITVSNKLGKFFWTQNGDIKSGQGRIFSASIDLPEGSSAANRKDIEVVAHSLPATIDLEFDGDEGVLYWTDRGEMPFGNTLNKKTLVGPVPEVRNECGREIIAQGFGEAIELRLDKSRQRILVAD
ncbi:hypothetical protein B0A48_02620 [Cryoendolithus antarcticus]|uniref:SMP-30/Gluconolactonase/LRE-like region domain-containing protein n=1 Tax=Cryoendolithus antarcticus TaxID=1507870 RepID=A0A1V8TP62_9PEZI|nr:hypothetical protein B0A48_02620 [Cryoendolithus antarcticus]